MQFGGTTLRRGVIQMALDLLARPLLLQAFYGLRPWRELGSYTAERRSDDRTLVLVFVPGLLARPSSPKGKKGSS